MVSVVKTVLSIFLALSFMSIALAFGCGADLYSNTNLTSDFGPCPAAGLVVHDGVTLDCAGHSIIGSGSYAGVALYGSGITVKNCNVSNFGEGISNNNGGWLPKTDNDLIMNNTVSGSQDNGMFIYGDYATIFNNTVRTSVNSGIYVLLSASPNITGNTIKDLGAGAGIYYQNNNNGFVIGNTVNNTSTGILMSEGASNNSVQNNSVKYTRVSGGFYILGPNNRLINNTACSNLDKDIHLSASYSNNSGDNTCDTLLDDDSNSVTCSRKCEVQVNTCQNLTTAGGSYRLNTSLSGNQAGGAMCINIKADNITFDCNGYSISGDTSHYGVTFNGRSNVLIKNCIISNYNHAITDFNNPPVSPSLNAMIFNNTVINNCVGISLSYGSNNPYIFNNTVNGTVCSLVDRGIYLYSITNASVINNTIINVGENGGQRSGLNLQVCLNSTIRGNNISYNIYNGIALDNTNNTDISSNILNNNFQYGISIAGSHKNNFTNNTVNSNVAGVAIFNSNNTTAYGNNFSSNTNGIQLTFSSYNNFTSNRIILSSSYAIQMDGSSISNRIWNNLFSNTHNAYDLGTNFWNTTYDCSSGPSIIDTACIGGNSWSDYNGTDLDGDGIGDTNLPYNAGGNIINGGDYLPLKISVDNIPPVIHWSTIIPPALEVFDTVTVVADVTDNVMLDNVSAIITGPSDRTLLLHAINETSFENSYIVPASGNFSVTIKAVDWRSNTAQAAAGTFNVTEQPPEPPNITECSGIYSLGIASQPSIVDANKTRALMSVDYYCAKNILGLWTYNFYLEIKYLNGSYVQLDGADVNYGKYPPTGSTVFVLNRPALFNWGGFYDQVIVTIGVWVE